MPLVRAESFISIWAHYPTHTAVSKMTVRCRWRDKTARRRIGHPSSYAEIKGIRSQKHHTHGFLGDCLRGCFSSNDNKKLMTLSEWHLSKTYCLSKSRRAIYWVFAQDEGPALTAYIIANYILFSVYFYRKDCIMQNFHSGSQQPSSLLNTGSINPSLNFQFILPYLFFSSPFLRFLLA